MAQFNPEVTKDNMRENFVPIVLKVAKCPECNTKLKESVIDGFEFCDNPHCALFLNAKMGTLRYKKQVFKCNCYRHADLKTIIKASLKN